MDTKDLKQLATKLRIDILEMTSKANSGHVGGSLSVIDILTTLYFGEIDGKPILKTDPKNPDWEQQDYFVLSKGHAAPALYAVLAELGFFSKEELNNLRQVDSLLQGHPVRKIPGVHMTTGSLGQGLSAANGMAMSLKLDKKPNRVYCVMGDGELQEGQIWEAAMTSAHYKLDNLTAFVDNNKLQIDGFCSSIMNVEPIQNKFEGFGWKVIKVMDGNDTDQLIEAVVRAHNITRQPTLILANTIKGKDVCFAENKCSYHGVALSPEELTEAVKYLNEKLEKLKAV